MAGEQTPTQDQAAPGTDIPADDFAAEWQGFLGHSFDNEDTQVDNGTGEQGEESTSASTTGDPGSTAAEPNEDATSGTTTAAAAPQASGEPPVEAAPAVTGDEIDPALLAAALGLSDPPAAAPAATSTGTGESEASTSTSPEAEVFAPFQPTFRLKPEVVRDLFEAEDTETREKALVGLLSAFGNTITQVVDQRMTEHHAPRIQESFASVHEARTVETAIKSDFNQAFPELAPYGAAVKKAFQVIAAQDPKAPYSPELRDKVGALARAAVKAGGIALPDRQAAAPATVVTSPPAPAKKEPLKATAFEAGAARPGGTGSTGGDSGPADLVNQLSEF